MNNTTLTLKMKRAISELRSGGKVIISDNSTGTSILLMSAELIDKESVRKLSEIALSSFYYKSEVKEKHQRTGLPTCVKSKHTDVEKN